MSGFGPRVVSSTGVYLVVLLMAPTRILYCHCAYAKIISPGVKDAVLAELARSGEPFEAVADLCELSARRDPSLARLAEPNAEVRIAACFPRSVKWLFKAAGAPLAEGESAPPVEICNMREEDPKTIVETLLREPSARPASAET